MIGFEIILETQAGVADGVSRNASILISYSVEMP